MLILLIGRQQRYFLKTDLYLIFGLTILVTESYKPGPCSIPCDDGHLHRLIHSIRVREHRR